MKTIGLRITEETYAILKKAIQEKLPWLASDYGVGKTDSDILRVSLSYLTQSPPNKEELKKFLYACKDDDTFSVFLQGFLKQEAPQG